VERDTHLLVALLVNDCQNGARVLAGLEAGKDLALLIGREVRQVFAQAHVQQVGLQVTQVGFDVFGCPDSHSLLYVQGPLELSPVDEECGEADDYQRCDFENQQRQQQLPS
jgi:hypothetical protein